MAWQHRILEEDVDVTKVEQPRPIFLALKCNIDVMTRDLNEYLLILVIIPSLPLRIAKLFHNIGDGDAYILRYGDFCDLNHDRRRHNKIFDLLFIMLFNRSCNYVLHFEQRGHSEDLFSTYPIGIVSTCFKMKILALIRYYSGNSTHSRFTISPSVSVSHINHSSLCQ